MFGFVYYVFMMGVIGVGFGVVIEVGDVVVCVRVVSGLFVVVGFGVCMFEQVKVIVECVDVVVVGFVIVDVMNEGGVEVVVELVKFFFVVIYGVKW